MNQMNTDNIEIKIAGNEPSLDTSSLDKRMVVVKEKLTTAPIEQCLTRGVRNSESFCGAMTELERKFIIMSRISVALARKGIFSSVTMHEGGFCLISFGLNSYKSEDYVRDDVYSNRCTEAELLEWWAEVER
jgi:hypothetical protein